MKNSFANWQVWDGYFQSSFHFISWHSRQKFINFFQWAYVLLLQHCKHWIREEYLFSQDGNTVWWKNPSMPSEIEEPYVHTSERCDKNKVAWNCCYNQHAFFLGNSEIYTLQMLTSILTRLKISANSVTIGLIFYFLFCVCARAGCLYLAFVSSGVFSARSRDSFTGFIMWGAWHFSHMR